MPRHVVLPAHPGASTLPTLVDIKHARERSRRLVHAPHNRRVDRFWSEKCLVVIDALQLYALLWQLAQPWPWPARWLTWTRWVNACNIDVFSFRARGAAMGATSQPYSLWGEIDNYWLYALGFSLVPWLLMGGFRVLVTHWETHGRDDVLTRQSLWTNVLIHVFYVLYLPIGLAVLRLVNCNADGRVSVDPFTFPSCYSTSHVLVVLGITCGAGGAFLLGFPLWLRRTVNDMIMTNNAEEHERFLQSTELAYILGISNAYMELCLPSMASFCVHGVQSWANMCSVKLVLLLIFSVLRSRPPSSANQGLQGNLFVGVLFVIAWKQTWRPVFRVDTTNQLAKLLSSLLVANGVVAVLCANGVRSALTVATSVTASLTFLNVVILSIVALSLSRSVKMWCHRQDLVPSIGGQLRSMHACWPTHPLMEEIISDRMPLEEWIQDVHDASALCLQTALAVSTAKPVHELAITVKRLDKSWQEATAHGHLLANQLRQELLLLIDVHVDALGTSLFNETELQARHEKEFTTLAEHLRRREENHRLLPAGSRRVLSKLRVAQTWSAVQREMNRQDQ